MYKVEQQLCSKPDSPSCNAAMLHCLSPLHCTAALTLASVVTGLLEEYIQWAASPPPHPIYYLPQNLSLEKGAGCAIYVLEPSLSYPSQGASLNPMKRAQSAFLHIGGHFTV